MKKSSIIITIFILMLALAGCVNNNTDKTSSKLNVYTSIYPLYDFTYKIGGDKINVQNMVPQGTEPHLWEPTPTEIAKLSKADMLIYNGMGVESWIDKVIASNESKNLSFVETSKVIEKNQQLANDPHIWLNPIFAKKQMELIKNELSLKDSANKDFYQANYEKYAAEFDNLDKLYKDEIGKLPNKAIVVSHSAFGYLCNAYGLNQIAIEGINAEAEPSLKKMAEISDYVKQNNIKVIFFEELISPKISESIAKETGAKVDKLNPLEGLSEEDISLGKDYFDIMKDNLEALKRALK